MIAAMFLKKVIWKKVMCCSPTRAQWPTPSSDVSWGSTVIVHARQSSLNLLQTFKESSLYLESSNCQRPQQGKTQINISFVGGKSICQAGCWLLLALCLYLLHNVQDTDNTIKYLLKKFIQYSVLKEQSGTSAYSWTWRSSTKAQLQLSTSTACSIFWK